MRALAIIAIALASTSAWPCSPALPMPWKDQRGKVALDRAATGEKTAGAGCDTLTRKTR